ncbi:GAP family protein [Nesterenkonia cremea]|uniref:Sap, sulfolipid-1-addressing protein n=1 Tax=Nesterenkonia cremea TaxID=1882340 RepID=A0A917ANI5_9MICC|nr:GAP family protein [Nesterenkonia cremea]GGE60128.1 hypothetical protein GCM10011401_03750 [Nesterenkonia cremea]
MLNHFLSAGPSPLEPLFGLSSLTEGLVPDGAQGAWSILGILGVLALLDSTSFGTLLIPVWLLMAPGRLRGGRILGYLGVVAGAYAAIGLILLASLVLVGDHLIGALSELSAQPAFLLGQAALGAGLIWFSCRLDPFTQAGKERKRRREEARGTGGRVAQFRERAVGDGAQGGAAALLGLALAAVGLEIATLLPYLAGIAVVAAETPEAPMGPAMILFYCMVMITPALVLLVLRLTAHRVLERPLKKLEGFLSRHANGTVALILFLLGLWLVLGAA